MCKTPNPKVLYYAVVNNWGLHDGVSAIVLGHCRMGVVNRWSRDIGGIACGMLS